MDNYDFVKKHRGKAIEATHKGTGIRSRFYVAEHANFGRGYFMVDCDRKIQGVVSEECLTDLVALDITPQEIWNL